MTISLTKLHKWLTDNTPQISGETKEQVISTLLEYAHYKAGKK